MFFDSHCHLSSDALSSQFADVLSRAQEANVSTILNVSDGLEVFGSVIEQAQQKIEPNIEIYATAGVHPHQAHKWNESSVKQLRAQLQQPRVVAVGEIGLDWFYDDSHTEHPGATRKHQIEVLELQLQIAIENDLPVVLHNREADRELIECVSKFPTLRGVFHCFNSNQQIAEQVLAMGFYLGFGGMTTFKNAHTAREIAQWCPIDRMLIETDAPYLAPVPMRGKTNEPAFVAHTANFLSELRGISLEELALATSDNSRRLFGL